MATTESYKGLGRDKKYTIIILQWVIAIATSFLILFPKGEVSLDPAVYALVVLFLFSGLVLNRLPESVFYHRYFDFGLLVWDTILLSAAIYVNRHISWELFLLYFFVLFLAAMGESMLKIVLGSVAFLSNRGKISCSWGVMFLFVSSSFSEFPSFTDISQKMRIERDGGRRQRKRGSI